MEQWKRNSKEGRKCLTKVSYRNFYRHIYQTPCEDWWAHFEILARKKVSVLYPIRISVEIGFWSDWTLRWRLKNGRQKSCFSSFWWWLAFSSFLLASGKLSNWSLFIKLSARLKSWIKCGKVQKLNCQWIWMRIENLFFFLSRKSRQSRCFAKRRPSLEETFTFSRNYRKKFKSEKVVFQSKHRSSRTFRGEK